MILKGKVISQINDISNTIASAVEEQTATTNEIGRNASEGAQGTQHIAQNIAGVADAARASAQGASQSQQAAAALSQLAGNLKTLVSRFTLHDIGGQVAHTRLPRVLESSRRADPARAAEKAPRNHRLA